jgi:hypothetical protein
VVEVTYIPKFEELSGPVHQSLRDLHSYWLDKKGSAIAPPRRVIDPAEIVPLLPNVALVDVVGDVPRFRVRLFGTSLAAAYGRDLTGKFLDEIDGNGLGPEAARRMRKVAEDRCPQTVRVRVTKQEDGNRIEYERIALPLSADGHTVDMILCGFAIERAVSFSSAEPAIPDAQVRDWRRRADNLRAMGNQMTDAQVRDGMLRGAVAYEAMADAVDPEHNVPSEPAGPRFVRGPARRRAGPRSRGKD